MRETSITEFTQQEMNLKALSSLEGMTRYLKGVHEVHRCDGAHQLNQSSCRKSHTHCVIKDYQLAYKGGMHACKIRHTGIYQFSRLLLIKLSGILSASVHNHLGEHSFQEHLSKASQMYSFQKPVYMINKYYNHCLHH